MSYGSGTKRSVLPVLGSRQKSGVPIGWPPTPPFEFQREEATPTEFGLVLWQAGMMMATTSAASRAAQTLPLVICRPSKVFGFYYIQDAGINFFTAGFTATPRRTRRASSGGRPRRRTGPLRPGRAPASSGRPAR